MFASMRSMARMRLSVMRRAISAKPRFRSSSSVRLSNGRIWDWKWLLYASCASESRTKHRHEPDRDERAQKNGQENHCPPLRRFENNPIQVDSPMADAHAGHDPTQYWRLAQRKSNTGNTRL